MNPKRIARYSRQLQRAAVGVTATVLLIVCLPVAAEAQDTTAPDPPAGVFVEQGATWQSSSRFDVWWLTPPGQETPIAIAHYRLCPAVPLGPCTEHAASGSGITDLHIELPHPGWFWLRVWLEDEAGNVNPGAKSPQVMLRFDDVQPPEALLIHEGGWLGDDAPTNPTYAFEIPFNAEWPMSGIRGYSISIDGSVPDASAEVLAEQDNLRFPGLYEFPFIEEGTTHVRFRSVSNAGVASQHIGSAYIRVDRTAPSISDPSTSAARWYQNELAIYLQALDQDHLSGMTPSNGPVVEEGAHIAYQLDGGVSVKVRGDSATVPITTDGHHKLTYRAFDAAGNGSVEKEAMVRIDGTAPVGRFRALDPGDPRRLEVEVSDATSGVAEGRIEYRKVGEREFGSLPTTLGNGVLAARIDDEGLPAGRYELRAVVTDVAGNEAVVGRWADGTSATLALPLRSATRIEVTGDTVTKVCAKPRRQARGKRGKQRKRRPACRRVIKRGATLAPGFGRRATTAGRLTSSNGAPVGGAPVAIEGQPRSGGDYVPLGTARTDTQGNFAFSLPAGPSRTVRYRYTGTDTALPATATLATKVPAAARLKVNRRRLRNGQTVRFTGRLLGRPIPAAGKVVALQAKVGRRWRTFANPRANAKGAFRHRYRFTSTTGVRRYAFRAVVAREAAYPYERGSSPIVRVTVRGR